MGSREAIFTKFAPGGPWGKLFMDLKSNLEKVISKTPFLTPEGAKWGQSGPNPIFCPIFTIFTVKGPFWKLWTMVKSNFRKNGFFPHLAPQWGSRGAKWDQILFFAWSSPFSQWRDHLTSYEQWISQIEFETLAFSPPKKNLAPFCPHGAPFGGPNGD